MFNYGKAYLNAKYSCIKQLGRAAFSISAAFWWGERERERERDENEEGREEEELAMEWMEE